VALQNKNNQHTVQMMKRRKRETTGNQWKRSGQHLVQASKQAARAEKSR